ncbi:uncharacterized protein LOC106871338 isoform X3 [Octopus bimaculoides]|uniref:uncharacterized protein LOC106871338 isoform X3 n=1 Tax=Octopus bimaculoides TaxID=37653 RepID=UPI0022E95C05|nr:uncharacterized protein LOC106871338 isoform X3 [Octopus bimaculoides]
MGQESEQTTATAIMIAGSYNSKCKKNLEACPAGHEMRECADGRYCEQCEDTSYQPNSNKYGDKCRLRKVCTQRFMKYQHHGSTVRDADCMCFEGYHFENEDQRACVPNRECDKGYGQGPYGVCENCLAKNMYSDVKDRLQACKPLKNCEKVSRCTLKKSNGTFDNVCGPVMDDIVNCDNLTTEKPKVEESSNTAIIVGCVSVLLFVGVIVALCYYFCFHRPRSRSHKKRAPTQEELDAVVSQVIENAKKDEKYCKQALNTSCTIIENNIGRQIWSLPQELFRKHFQAGKYEVIVEKYKGDQPKAAVNGYFREWRSWKEDKAETITDLFTCLKTCNRIDIVYMIATKLNEIDSLDVPEKLSDKEDSLQKQKPSYMGSLLYSMFPCLGKKRRYPSEEKASEKPETMNRLLDTESGAELQHQTQQPGLPPLAAATDAMDAQQTLSTAVIIPPHAPVNCTPYRASAPSAPILEDFELQQQQQQQTLSHHPHSSYSQPPPPPQQNLQQQQQQQQQNQLHRQHLPPHHHHHAA